ncbi:MAG: YIP1 family protein [Candidatus Binatia bacterium]
MPLAQESASGPVVARLCKAIALRAPFYRAIAADPAATGQAAAVVCLSGLIRESGFLRGSPGLEETWGLAVLVVVVLSALGWLIYGLIGFLLARLLSPGRVSLSRLLRCLGYAETVTILRVLAHAIEPRWYPLLHVVLLLWSFAALWVAVHSALEVSRARSALVALPLFVAQQAVLQLERMAGFGIPVRADAGIQ